MNNELLNKILCIDNFIIEQDTSIDNTSVYIRPLYIEMLSLYPMLQKELATDISVQISKYNPEVLYAVEASILPISSIVSQNLNIPLSIVRKPNNYKHEKEEPQIYIKQELKSKRSVLLDDAIWSGYTMHYVLDLFQKLEIVTPSFYFLFDFLDFNKGGRYLSEYELMLLNNRESWVTYKKCVENAYEKGLISHQAYVNTMNLFF